MKDASLLIVACVGAFALPLQILRNTLPFNHRLLATNRQSRAREHFVPHSCIFSACTAIVLVLVIRVVAAVLLIGRVPQLARLLRLIQLPLYLL